MCDRCDELEEEVAYLRSELGLVRDSDVIARLRDHMRGVEDAGGHRPHGAQVVAALYAAKGRPLTRLQLLDACPSRTGSDERGTRLIDVWVYHARRSLGRDAIANVWGSGYRLTEIGMAKVGEIAAGPQQDRAA